MPTITTSDGVRLDYADAGEGTPVVLIAGFCAPLDVALVGGSMGASTIGAYYDQPEQTSIAILEFLK